MAKAPSKTTLRSKMAKVQKKMVTAFKDRAKNPGKLNKLYKEYDELNRKYSAKPNKPPKAPKPAKAPKPPARRQAKKRV